MAKCLHKHLQLHENTLYGCIVCGRPFVVEPAELDVAPEHAEAAPEPVAVEPEPEPAPPEPAPPEPVAEIEPEAPPAPEEPDVDISQQLRVYLAGKPREVPASARRRRKAKPTR